MIYNWQYEGKQEILLRTFLRDKGMSKKLLAQVKYHGGNIYLNEKERTVLAKVGQGDRVTVHVPDEGEHETLVPVDLPVDILFEDEHFLIVDKPTGVVSIPSKKNPHLSMANRVKGYYKKRNYADQIIHIVTRLDRDTTGLMLFGKNRFSHALMDKQLQAKSIERIYYAILSNKDALPEKHGFIDAPIGRTDDSIINRMVREDGKAALTEYWIVENFPEGQLVRIKLHSGRTHQIRVHFAHIGAPLIGDTLYGGRLDPLIERQALHCKYLNFINPFTGEDLQLEAAFPDDFTAWMDNQRSKGDV